jgi:hypothetical protein
MYLSCRPISYECCSDCFIHSLSLTRFPLVHEKRINIFFLSFAQLKSDEKYINFKKFDGILTEKRVKKVSMWISRCKLCEITENNVQLMVIEWIKNCAKIEWSPKIQKKKFFLVFCVIQKKKRYHILYIIYISFTPTKKNIISE